MLPVIQTGMRSAYVRFFLSYLSILWFPRVNANCFKILESLSVRVPMTSNGRFQAGNCNFSIWLGHELWSFSRQLSFEVSSLSWIESKRDHVIDEHVRLLIVAILQYCVSFCAWKRQVTYWKNYGIISHVNGRVSPRSHIDKMMKEKPENSVYVIVLSKSHSVFCKSILNLDGSWVRNCPCHRYSDSSCNENCSPHYRASLENDATVRQKWIPRIQLEIGIWAW